jgi:hypothetical protein
MHVLCLMYGRVGEKPAAQGVQVPPIGPAFPTWQFEYCDTHHTHLQCQLKRQGMVSEVKPIPPSGGTLITRPKECFSDQFPVSSRNENARAS